MNQFDDAWYNATFDALFSAAQDRLKKTGSLPTTFVLIGARETRAFIGGWANYEERELAFLTTKLACVAYNAQGLMSITEAWMAAVKADASGAMPSVRASDLPDRKEVLMGALWWRTAFGKKRSVSALSEIERNAHGAISGFRNLDPGPDELGGEIAGLLPEIAFNDAERASALRLLNVSGVQWFDLTNELSPWDLTQGRA